MTRLAYRLLLAFLQRLTLAQRAELRALLLPRIEISGRDGDPVKALQEIREY